MSEDLDQFMTYLCRLGLGASTVQLYLGSVSRALDGATPERGAEWILGEARLGASSLETYRKALLHWASFKNDVNLAERLRTWRPGPHPKRKKGPARALDLETEWPKLRAAALCHEDVTLAATLYLVLTTGLRIAEVLDLTGAALRAALRDGVVTIKQKGNKDRDLMLPTGSMQAQANVLALVLLDRATVAHALQTSRRKTRGGVEDYVRRELQRLATAAGIPGKIGPHVCRRTVGDAVWEKSRNMRAVAAVLGDTVRTTEEHYQDHNMPRTSSRALASALGEDGEENG
jgi:integrase